MASFRSINVNGLADEIGPTQSRLRSLTGVGQVPLGAEMSIVRDRLARSNEETASRLLLQTYLEDADSESLLSITSPERPELVPNMRLENSALTPDLNARSVTYQQLSSRIPIFGGRVVVDVDADAKTLVAINGKVAPLPNMSPLASVTAEQAWESLLKLPRGERLAPHPDAAPTLLWHLGEDNGEWHLAYHFRSVPLSPPPEVLPTDLPDIPHACVRHSMRSRNPSFDYFVDANSGEIIFFFSSHPTLNVPTPLTGLDCFNQRQTIYGLLGQGEYFFIDPIRNIETYDFGFQDLDNAAHAFPGQAIGSVGTDLGNARPQAMSAHYHAQVVYDFFNGQLKRDGIDDKGMKLVSVVNVYSSVDNPLPAPQWGNAVWWQGKMWYGEENGQSFAKHLDVIAHELTHGVTESSSNLIYRRLSGALNESFSDIFGIIIANWHPGEPNPVSTWKWEIGSGLGPHGGPIRNFADPKAAGQPDHMNQYKPLPLSYDEGGVHIYSGIHNKAVYLMLAETTSQGDAAFPTAELALLLYLTLTRLTPTSVFSDSRRTLENVVSTYHSGNATTRAVRHAVIKRAFDAVGII
jgi:bacillolysin